MSDAELIRDPETGKMVAPAHLMFKALPGYPWLPCPICGFTGSCDHTVLERARRAIPGLVIPAATKDHS